MQFYCHKARYPDTKQLMRSMPGLKRANEASLRLERCRFAVFPKGMTPMAFRSQSNHRGMMLDWLLKACVESIAPTFRNISRFLPSGFFQICAANPNIDCQEQLECRICGITINISRLASISRSARSLHGSERKRHLVQCLVKPMNHGKAATRGIL